MDITPRSVSVSPDGSKVYVAGSNPTTISLIATATNEVVAAIPLDNPPGEFALTPDGAFIYVSMDASPPYVAVIDTATHTIVTTIPMGSGSGYVAITPDGAFAYVSNLYSWNVQVISTSNNTVFDTIPFSNGDFPADMAVSPNGASLCVPVPSWHGSYVAVVDTATNDLVASIPRPGGGAYGAGAIAAAFTRDGAFVYVTNDIANTISVINTATKAVVATIPVGQNPYDIAIAALPPSEPDAAGVWVGLKNSDDQGTQFDLRTEVYKNSTPIASGVTACITGLTSNPDLAKLVSVPVGSLGALFHSGDSFSVKILTRIGTDPDGSKCSGSGGSHSNAVGLRLYYDSISRSSGVTLGLSPLFMHSTGTNVFLDNLTPTSGSSKYKDSAGVDFANGNPWKEIGAWIMTVP